MDDKKKVIDGQLYWHHSLLSNWEKNSELRVLKTRDWLRLLKSIKKYGINTPFEIGDTGITYDGNHRLSGVNEHIAEGVLVAENGKSLEWIPVHINTPQNPVEELALALQGNDQEFAVWNKDAVMNNQDLFQQIPDFQEYAMLSEVETFSDFFAPFSDPGSDEPETQTASLEKKPKEIQCPSCNTVFEIK